MINGTIQNIISQGDSITVFVYFSDGNDANFSFAADQVTKQSIKTQIKAEVDRRNAQLQVQKDAEIKAQKVAKLLEDLKGQIIS